MRPRASFRAVPAAVALGTLTPLATVTARAAWAESSRLSRRTEALAFDDLVLACALVVLAATAGWLMLAAALTAISLGRGRLATLADPWARRVTPAVMRGVLGATCGAVVMTTASSTSAPAVAAPMGPTSADACALVVDTAATLGGLPMPDRPTADDLVVVRRGDSLWSIARRELPADASDAAVARAWPRWFAVNRRPIGPDPDLVRPGTLLSRPHALPTRQGRR